MADIEAPDTSHQDTVYPENLPAELVPLWDEFLAEWSRTRYEVARIHADECVVDPMLSMDWTKHDTCVLGWFLIMRSPRNEKYFAPLNRWIAKGPA